MQIIIIIIVNIKKKEQCLGIDMKPYYKSWLFFTLTGK